MKRKSATTRPTRQWRITVTEGALDGLMRCSLSWRTFPCKADDWDGHRYSQYVDIGRRIGSADDLEAVLLAAVEGEWWQDARRVHR